MTGKHTEYISLKEAARLSGYSSDYIGQLIRGGKLHGKQVYSNVSWMTTREAIHEYLEKDAKEKSDEPIEGYLETLKRKVQTLEGVALLSTTLIWVFITLLVCVSFVLLYILAVSIDHTIEQTYLSRVEYEY